MLDKGLTPLVEAALKRYFPKGNKYTKVLLAAMAYSLFLPSKRFRPILTMLVAEACGYDSRLVLPTACAIEFIHTYSLIHDDLPELDNGQLRRGKPTCHLVYGPDIALLAGDALFAEAFVLIAQHQVGTETQKLKVMSELAAACGVSGMVGGQVADVEAAKKLAQSQEAETLNFIHTHKTGRLIQAAAYCGAVLAGADGEVLNKVAAYGGQLGLAFQIVDDILDDVGDIKSMGKTKGKDKELNKLTFVKLYGLDKAKKKAQEAVEKAVAYITSADLKSNQLVDLAYFVLERQS